MIRLPLIVLLSSLTVLSSAPVRGACTDGPEVCVDGPGSKFINGVEVWRECWNYQTTRHCTSSSTVDYCSGLKQTPGCRQTKAECLSYSLTGTCMSWNSTYVCSEEAKETENIEILDSSHTVISGTDTTTCSSFLDNPDCYIAEEKCIEGPETRIINGVAVYKECWKKELAFACAAPGASNSCQILASKGCQPIGEKVCERIGADGACAQYSQKFHCVNTDPIEGDDITPEDTPSKPGFDLLACKTATEGMTCKASSYSCMQTNDKGECIQRKYIYNCTQSLNENACEALEKLPECEVRKSNATVRSVLLIKRKSSAKVTQKSPLPALTSSIQTSLSAPLSRLTPASHLKIILPARCFEPNVWKARQKRSSTACRSIRTAGSMNTLMSAAPEPAAPERRKMTAESSRLIKTASKFLPSALPSMMSANASPQPTLIAVRKKKALSSRKPSADPPNAWTASATDPEILLIPTSLKSSQCSRPPVKAPFTPTTTTAVSLTVKSMNAPRKS